VKRILNQKQIRHIHCLGIGGIGVSGLAEILLRKGYHVSGSDPADTAITQRLTSLGAHIDHQHVADNLRDAHAIVYSSAIAEQNPEFMAAKAQGLPTIRRGELLAQLLHEYKSVCVSGTHGKTTTTAIIAHILLTAGVDPTYVLGGILNNADSPVRLGASDIMVAEADESDASFLYMEPTWAVITNVEPDHMCTYQGDVKQLHHSFIQFANSIADHGCVICGIDDAGVNAILAEIQSHTLTFGFSQSADIRATDFEQVGLQSHFTIRQDLHEPLAIELNAPGIHNVQNALAAFAVCQQLGVKPNLIQAALKTFPGVGRRFHSQGDVTIAGKQVHVYDDYGHHPTEVKMTLQAAKKAWPTQRVVMVFQPHRYTRTRDLMQEFIDVLSDCDCLVLLDVYGAGELPIEGADGNALFEAIAARAKVKPFFVPNMAELSHTLQGVLQQDDIVLFQGAGSIGPAANQFVKECEK